MKIGVSTASYYPLETEVALEEIGKAGFDPVYGARPLRRAIQQQIEDKLSEEMLEGKFSAGNKYTCVYEDGAYKFIEITE